MSEIIVEKGFIVKVDYTGKFNGGEVFDSSKGREPLEIIVGNGELIKGFDDSLVGMKVGEEKEISIEAKDAYGAHNDSLIQEVPKAALGKDMKVEVGMTLGMQVPGTEHVLPVVVKEVGEENVTLDANHPLAGKDLNFSIKIIEARKATEEDLAKRAQPKPQEHEHDHDEEVEGCSGSCSGCSGC